jgi:hypothetical protein
MAALPAACIDAAIFPLVGGKEMKSFSLMISCPQPTGSVAESRRGSIILVETLAPLDATILYLPQELSALVKLDSNAEHLG